MKNFTIREFEVRKTGMIEGNNFRVEQKTRLTAWRDHLIEGGIRNKFNGKSCGMSIDSQKFRRPQKDANILKNVKLL